MEITALDSYLFRWVHMLAGVAWIGLLYYFNFVQTEYFKVAEPSAKSSAISQLVPRALWWFRFGALFTFLSGLALAAYLGVARVPCADRRGATHPKRRQGQRAGDRLVALVQVRRPHNSQA